MYPGLVTVGIEQTRETLKTPYTLCADLVLLNFLDRFSALSSLTDFNTTPSRLFSQPSLPPSHAQP